MNNNRVVGRKKYIGVVVPAHIELARSVLQGVRAYCKDHPDTRMLLVSAVDRIAKGALPTQALDCIVVQDSSSETVNQLRQITPHVVVTSNRSEISGVGLVLNDDNAIGRMGAKYFLQRGFKTLAFVRAEGRDDHNRVSQFKFAVEREAGFCSAANASGTQVHSFAPHNQNECPDLVEQLLSLPLPVGVMTSSDLHARWLIEAMDEPLKIVPQKLAILGVDNDSLENALSPVALSSVCPSGKTIGYEAATLGMRMAEGEPVSDEPVRISPRYVVTRQSTSVYAVDDPLVLRALKLIQDRISDLTDTNDLLALLRVPRRTLEWHFRKSLASSPARELMQARIQRATELLAGTNLSIKEIAFLVGFSEPRVLSRSFLQIKGERPSEFRQRIHADFADSDPMP
ncbi:MAG: substrate-binding domain-containing protein [Verrucomicrobia bacterium]|nr:substrate-binding domain-containing protein [Verrucomicrobiota bacterium]